MRFSVSIKAKKDIYISAKNKREAKKKAKELMKKKTLSKFFKIDYVEETIF